MVAIRIPYFQIWYSSVFLTIAFITWVATLVSPTDLIWTCIRIKNIPNGIAVGAIYVGTLVIGFFIWSSRIYTNRAALKEIPRAYIPVDKGEVPRKVHKMIKKQWERSAIVAWDSRPRDLTEELAEVRQSQESERHGIHGLLHPRAEKRTVIAPDVSLAAWGTISHPGWSSPANAALPNLEYYRVFVELPNLIEAKAVSLAPPDPVFNEIGVAMDTSVEPIPDARIVALLQRPATQGLREYLTQLGDFNLINPPDAAEDFLAQYEQARFSTCSLSEKQFQNLMAAFSTLLTGMTELDIAAVEMELEGSSSASSLRTFTTSTESLPHAQSNRLSAMSGPSSRYTHARTTSTGTVRTAPSRAKTPQPLHHAP